jgi:predicted dehydrogenase
MPDAGKVRVGIIGLGIGRFHASALQARGDVSIVAVADRSARKVGGALEDFAAHYGARAYRQGADLLDREQLDLAIICTPPGSHLELVERAIGAGAAVLLEKPISWSKADARRIASAAETAKVPLHLNFPMRGLGAVRRAKEVLRGEELGRPKMVAAEYVMGSRSQDHWVWTDTGGPIVENTCHFIDLLAYLLGPIAEVRAALGVEAPIGRPAVESAAALLRFENGVVGSLLGGASGTAEFSIRPRISLYCDNGQLLLEGTEHTLTRVEWRRRGGALECWSDSVAPVPPPMLGPLDRYPLIEPALNEVIRRLKSGEPPLAGAADGLRALELGLDILALCRVGGVAPEPVRASVS